ncbi:MAG: type II secretion system F family protein, partial [Myxococcota bacterium]
MVRAGEASGTLDVVLQRLADFTESQANLRSKVIGALTYPMVMMLVALVVLGIILTTVVPRMTRIFEHSNMTLPLITRFMLGVSEFMQSYWWLLIILAIVAGYIFSRWKTTETGRAKWDRLCLQLPVFGPIIQMVAVARFARTLSTLLSSGVPLLTTLQIVRNVVASEPLEQAVDAVRDAVREGEDIATPLRKSGLFPPMVTHMIAIGERSGQLEEMLKRVAGTYEQRVDGQVSMLTSLLEPIMIVLMGGIVGIILFSVLLPMMQMSQLAE